jgi:prophage tail gpP-like protein
MEEAPVKIEIEGTGEIIKGIVDFTLSDDFTIPTDAFSATFYWQDPVALRRKLLPKTPVRIYVLGKLQVIGRIDRTRGVGRGSSALTIEGRDYLGDIVDASVDDSIRIAGGMTLADALLEGLRVFGIDEIETTVADVKNQRLGKRTSKEVKASDDYAIKKYREAFDISTRAFVDSLPERTKKITAYEPIESNKPSENEGAFAWASRLAARSGFTIQPGSKRSSIAVVAPDYDSDVLYNLARPGNIEDGTADRNWASVPSVMCLRSRSVTTGLKTKGEAKIMSPIGDDSELSLWGIPEARRIMEASNGVGRRLPKNEKGDPVSWYAPVYYRDDESKSATQLAKAARREMSEHLRETMAYDCTMSAFEANGSLFATNTLAAVHDEVEDVDEVLWVRAREMSFGNGKQTRLKLIRPASYVI